MEGRRPGRQKREIRNAERKGEQNEGRGTQYALIPLSCAPQTFLLNTPLPQIGPGLDPMKQEERVSFPTTANAALVADMNEMALPAFSGPLSAPPPYTNPRVKWNWNTFFGQWALLCSERGGNFLRISSQRPDRGRQTLFCSLLYKGWWEPPSSSPSLSVISS